MPARIGVAGQCVEDNSGLHISGSRIVSPAARRFLAADARFEDPARALDAVHWGTDSEVSHRYIQRALPDIMRGRQDGEKVFIYTGVHGDELGRNWTLSERRFSETSFTQFDVSRRGSLEQAIGDHPLFIEELSVNNPAANLLLWHRPGTHVHACCFGAVDELLLTMFDVPPIPVYLL